MTAKDMKQLKEIVLKSCKINYNANDSGVDEIIISDSVFFDLIEWIDKLKKEVEK